MQAGSHKPRKERHSKQASQKPASSKKQRRAHSILPTDAQEPDKQVHPPSSENSDKTVQEQAVAKDVAAAEHEEGRDAAAGGDAGRHRSLLYYRQLVQEQGTIELLGRKGGDMKNLRCFVSIGSTPAPVWICLTWCTMTCYPTAGPTA
jgi:hypothetical protein